MEISWLGHCCFQLRGKNAVLITDPFPPQSAAVKGGSLQQGKINASIVTVSHHHALHSFIERVGGDPHIVRGPGEYEISDVLITGVASYHDERRGQLHGRSTIYVIHMDDIVICHLGDLDHTLQENQLEEVADADVLLIPIGGGNTLSPVQATEVISQVEPRIVIPMHYSAPLIGEVSNELMLFCREMGVEKIESQPKLSITRNTLPLETQVMLLSMR
jgi:L-ascorbate metabolism protein UlaG (beta-lactamase superfamily)